MKTQSAESVVTWSVYLIRTQVGHLYCGATNDLMRRFKQHQGGVGAKYLRGKGPLTLVWHLDGLEKSKALKLEYRIKRLSKPHKEHLCHHCLKTLEKIMQQIE